MIHEDNQAANRILIAPKIKFRLFQSVQDHPIIRSWLFINVIYHSHVQNRMYPTENQPFAHDYTYFLKKKKKVAEWEASIILLKEIIFLA